MIFIKYIKLSFIPFTINKKYNKAIKEVTNNKVLLFGEIDSQVLIFKNWFNKTQVTFKLENIDENEVNDKLNTLYGNHHYLMGAGTKVWKVSDAYITHGCEETRSGDVEHTLCVYLVKPCFMTNAKRFNQIDDIIKRVIYNWNLKPRGWNHIGIFGEINYFFETKDYEYFITIKKREIGLYTRINKKVGGLVHSLPGFYQIIKYKDINRLIDIINSFFIRMSRDDRDLEISRTIDVNVMFYSGKRKILPKTGYRPHLRLESDEMFYGIQFMKLDISSFDEFYQAKIKLIFPGIDYTNVKESNKFFINEGNNCVGEGYIVKVTED